MKVSVIATVLNEGASIALLLDSLLTQTRKPDEIIIVDGGSTDSTIDTLKLYERKYSKIRIFTAKANIAQGRNLAISKAKYQIIAQIDGGCIARPNWLRRLVNEFTDPEVGVAAGFYKMVAKNYLAEAAAPFLGVTANSFDPRSFMPSGRSVAFRKSVWASVGGYSEDLQWAGEDTLFNYHVIKKGIKIARVPRASVLWEVPLTFRQIASKFYTYAKGDAQTGIWWHPCKNLATHNIKIMLIYARYFSGLVLLFLSFFNQFFIYLLTLGLVFYIFWSMWKMKEEVRNQLAFMLVPFVQVLADFMVMAGFAAGVLLPVRPISFSLARK